MGLWLNAQRTETRRSYGMLRAIRDAFSNAVPQEYFRDLYDTEEQADAMYAAYLSRCASCVSVTANADPVSRETEING